MVYKQALNRIALNQLVKAPNIPDYHLMVGSAEELAPLPLLVSTSGNVPKEIAQNMERMSQLSNDEITESIANGTLEINDFNMNVAMLGV